MPITRDLRIWLAFQITWLLAAALMVALGVSWWVAAAVVIGAIAIYPTPKGGAALTGDSQQPMSRSKALLKGVLILLVGLAVALGLWFVFQHWG